MLLRAGPQSLPVSSVLLMLLLAGYFLLQTISGLNYFSLPQSAMASALDIALLAVFIQVSLQLNGKAARFHQTLLAAVGSWLLLGIVALPFIFVLADARNVGADPGIALWLLMGILIWSLTVLGHVLRHALEIPLSLALVLVVLYFLISQTLLELLVPMPAPTG